MTSGAIAVDWTFILSPTYTTLSLTVGILTILFLAARAIQRELLPMSGGKWVMVPILLSFGLIVMLRLSDLAYHPPDMLATVAAPTAVPTSLTNRPPTFGSAQYYFAGGTSSASTSAAIILFNPTTQITNVYLTFFFGGGLSATQTLGMPPTTHQTFPVGSFEQFAGSFGLRVVADQPIIAQLQLSRDGQSNDLLPGNTRLSTKWYLPGRPFPLAFQDSMAIFNPDPARPAHVTVHFDLKGKAAGLEAQKTVAPHSQLVAPMSSLEPKEAPSLIVTSDTPIAVTRTFTFGKNPAKLTMQVGLLTPAKS